MNRMRLLLAVLVVAACAMESQRGQPAAGPGGAEPSHELATGFVAPAPPITPLAPADEYVFVERDGSGPADTPGGGELRLLRPDGEETVVLPLARTDVAGRVTLHVASVTLTQRYRNPYAEKIEAVYVFPLPQHAAVTDFVMAIGERRIRGVVREREEARRLYLAARRQGHTASLLSQERANVFTQRVANIEPGKRIDVEIAYFHTVRWADGRFELVVPMVVGPRFHPPGTPSGRRVDVPYLRPRTVSGHTVSVAFDVDGGGLPLGDIESPSHAVRVARDGPARARVELAGADRLPNRDFVLRWGAARDTVRAALALDRAAGAEEAYFALLVQPPARLGDVPDRAREMVFVVDCSGSMEGEPLSTCKRAMRRCLRRLRRQDTFRIVGFSERVVAIGDPKPLAATPANVRRGLSFVDDLRAGGGTMMAPAMRAALRGTPDAERYRIVTFMTDGFIGNEADVLREVGAHLGAARVFSFGIGSSVNRYLLERMAGLGRGVAAYVGNDESGLEAVDALYRRLEQPAFTDLRVVWPEGVTVADTAPAPLPDLFVGRPVVLTGRVRGRGRATVEVHGRLGANPHVVRLSVDFDAPAVTDRSVAQLWARARIAALSDRLVLESTPALATEIRDLALRFGLASGFTSFVAVDASRTTEGTHGTTVPVPVPVPQGTRYETTVDED